MTIIATAIGGAILGALPTAVGTTLAGVGIGAGTVGAVTLGGTAAGIMGGVDAAQNKQMQNASNKQGMADAAAAAVPGTASTLYAAAPAASTTPIANSDQKLFATGGITALAKGGPSVRLEDSDYIIPADVVSALGNGSSKAGARYLQEQLARLNSVGGVGSLQPAKKLRATREAKKKHKA